MNPERAITTGKSESRIYRFFSRLTHFHRAGIARNMTDAHIVNLVFINHFPPDYSEINRNSGREHAVRQR